MDNKVALLRAGLLALLLAVFPLAARAAVTLVSFEAVPDDRAILVTWQTASEVDMVGFYVQRGLSESGAYHRVSGLIPATGGIIGATYEYPDTDVEAGGMFYYRLETLELTGYSEQFGPISATLPLPPTLTPTSTPVPTPTPAPTATPRQANVQFWAAQDHVVDGECTTLYWQVENAQAVYYRGQGVTGHDGRQECPHQTTTYVLRVVTDQGEERREVTVYVEAGTAAVTSAPTGTPTPIPTSSALAPSPTLPPPTQVASSAISPTATPLSAPATPSPAPAAAPQAAVLLPTPTLVPLAPSSPVPSSTSLPSPLPSVPAENPRLSLLLVVCWTVALLALGGGVIWWIWSKR